MKVRPRFDMFPANATEASAEHLIKLTLTFETGQEFYLLLATDKTDPNGFLAAGDFAGLLAGLAEGILHMDKTFKEKMAEAEIELGSAENPIEPIKYDA